MSDAVASTVMGSDNMGYGGSNSFGDAFRLLARVLTFRAKKHELLALNSYDLVLGLMFTWLVGIGRYWDNNRAELLQQLGVGSVIYVFALSTFLYLIIWPLRPKNWSWFKLLVFITMTSPPAVLYAIPVQMMFPEPGLDTANEINLVFLKLVSVWRVSLLVWYLVRSCEMDKWLAVFAVLLPMAMLVFVLTGLNLERVVFNIMGGFNEENASPNDDIYSIMVLLTFASFYAFIPLLLGYLILVTNINYRRRKERLAAEGEEVVDEGELAMEVRDGGGERGVEYRDGNATSSGK